MVRDGRVTEAVSVLEGAYEKKTSLAVLLKLTELYQGTGAQNRAIAELDKWIKAHPSDVDPRLQLAQVHTQMRNYRAATAQFEWLVNQRPTDPIMLNNLAWAYGRTGDQRARATAEKAYRLAPGLPMISDTLGWILATQDNAEEGMKYLQTALTEIPGDPDVQFHYALGLSKTQKTADARAMLQKLLASNADFDSKPDAKQLLSRLELVAKWGPPMIDSLAILLTTLAVLYVLVRARGLDRSLPWFETEDASSTETASKANRSPTGAPEFYAYETERNLEALKSARDPQPLHPCNLSGDSGDRRGRAILADPRICVGRHFPSAGHLLGLVAEYAGRPRDGRRRHWKLPRL